MTSYLNEWARSRAGNSMEFPVEAVQTVTIYPKWKDPSTGMQNAVRCTLNGCFWSGGSSLLSERTMQSTEFKAKLFIPHRASVTGREYIRAEEWYSLPIEDIEAEKYWTVDPENLPLVTDYGSLHKFVWSHSEDKSDNRLDKQIDDFTETSNVFRASKFEEYRFGINMPNKSMWHYVVYI